MASRALAHSIGCGEAFKDKQSSNLYREYWAMLQNPTRVYWCTSGSQSNFGLEGFDAVKSRFVAVGLTDVKGCVVFNLELEKELNV